MFFGYFSNLGCGGSIVASLLGTVLLIAVMFGLNSCFTGGAPLVVPGPGAPGTVSEAVDAGDARAPVEENPRTVEPEASKP